MLRKVEGVWYGTDPEGFFVQNGRVIGSERVLPKEGLGRIVRDGIQFELNPKASPSIRGLGNNVRDAFRDLHDHLGRYPDVGISYEGVVEVERAELDSLSEDSRILGCMPSRNAYGDKPITVDPLVYRKRSAGGHNHYGLIGTSIFLDEEVDERQRLVPLLDIFVGNTCVMLDRDPNAAERRENYGRAGEFRLPDHGLEYRTLSNFWIRNYALMSLVFGLGDIAISTLVAGIDEKLRDSVDLLNFIEAIDTNNFELARRNFVSLTAFFQDNLPKEGFVLNPTSLDRFLQFADLVKVKGLESIFQEDPMDHWVSGRFVEFSELL